MNKVYACIDGLAATAAVIDWAAWSALRLDLPLEFLHVLERDPDRSAATDLSGAIGFGAQESLLGQMSEIDAQRGKLAQEAGRQMLAKAQERARVVGVQRVDARMRHGEVVDGVLDMEPDARLFVLGEHFHATGFAKLHLDHHVERVVRAVKRPVLVVTSEHFAEPDRFVVAYDGSATARNMLETLARSPMLKGIPALIAMAAADTPESHVQLQEAHKVLTEAGFIAATVLLQGEPEQVLPELLEAQGNTLLVMGAYGHSRIRQLVVGSTTTTLLRLSKAPVLILR